MRKDILQRDRLGLFVLKWPQESGSECETGSERAPMEESGEVARFYCAHKSAFLRLLVKAPECCPEEFHENL